MRLVVFIIALALPGWALADSLSVKLLSPTQGALKLKVAGGQVSSKVVGGTRKGGSVHAKVKVKVTCPLGRRPSTIHIKSRQTGDKAFLGAQSGKKLRTVTKSVEMKVLKAAAVAKACKGDEQEQVALSFDVEVTCASKYPAVPVDTSSRRVKSSALVLCDKGDLRRPLVQMWSGKRQDNFSAGTKGGVGAAKGAGYGKVRVEGQLLPEPVAGTRPLKLFWHAGRGDNFSTASSRGETDAKRAGYKYVRVQGHVFTKPRTGTVPLKLYWNGRRGDNMTLATPASETAAKGAGYRLVRIEGYIYAH